MKRLSLSLLFLNTYTMAQPILIQPYPNDFNDSKASMVSGGANIINQFNTSVQTCITNTAPKNRLNDTQLAYASGLEIKIYIEVVTAFYKSALLSSVSGEDISTEAMTALYNGITHNGTMFVPLYATVAKCFDKAFTNYPVLDFRSAQQIGIFKNIAFSTNRSWTIKSAQKNYPSYLTECDGKGSEAPPKCDLKYDNNFGKIIGVTNTQWIELSK